MPRIDLQTVREVIGCGYPEPYDGPCRTRRRLTLGDAAGLTQFGVNLLRLEAGGWSSQRHWHSAEDEFLIVISGEVQLVTDQGEETLRAGDCAGFRAGDRNAHHLRNGSDGEAVILEVGSRKPDEDTVHYPDVDMIWEPGSGPAHKDGRPY